MIYLAWAWKALPWLIGLWLLSNILKPFLPSRFADKIEIMNISLLGKIVVIPILLYRIWFFTATILYFIGNFSALVLLALGAFMVGYSINLHLGNFQPTAEGLYLLSKQLIDEKAVWSGITILIAATVAIGHMWKLNLDRKKYFEDKERELK